MATIIRRKPKSARKKINREIQELEELHEEYKRKDLYGDALARYHMLLERYPSALDREIREYRAFQAPDKVTNGETTPSPKDTKIKSREAEEKSIARLLAEYELAEGNITSPKMILEVFGITMDQMKDARQEAVAALPEDFHDREPKIIDRLRQALETGFQAFLCENEKYYDGLSEYLNKKKAENQQPDEEKETRITDAMNFFLRREGLLKLDEILKKASLREEESLREAEKSIPSLSRL